MYKQKNYSQLLNEIESNSKIKSLIVKTEVSANDLSIYVDNEKLYNLLKLLRDDKVFIVLSSKKSSQKIKWSGWSLLFTNSI